MGAVPCYRSSCPSYGGAGLPGSRRFLISLVDPGASVALPSTPRIGFRLLIQRDDPLRPGSRASLEPKNSCCPAGDNTPYPSLQELRGSPQDHRLPLLCLGTGSPASHVGRAHLHPIHASQHVPRSPSPSRVERPTRDLTPFRTSVTRNVRKAPRYCLTLVAISRQACGWSKAEPSPPSR